MHRIDCDNVQFICCASLVSVGKTGALANWLGPLASSASGFGQWDWWLWLQLVGALAKSPAGALAKPPIFRQTFHFFRFEAPLNGEKNRPVWRALASHHFFCGAIIGMGISTIFDSSHRSIVTISNQPLTFLPPHQLQPRKATVPLFTYVHTHTHSNHGVHRERTAQDGRPPHECLGRQGPRGG